jgi:hypothetical protein
MLLRFQDGAWSGNAAARARPAIRLTISMTGYDKPARPIASTGKNFMPIAKIIGISAESNYRAG